MKRKLIGFITAFPESIYAQRYMEGVFAQCEKYGYDVAVFAPMTQVCLFQKDYLEGELNIYNLMNIELLDGIIVDGHSLSEDGATSVLEDMLDKLKKFDKPVVSLGMKLGDYPVLYTIDRHVFREITSHILDVHKCKDIYFLTGTEGHPTAIDRLSGFLDEMESRGLEVDKNNIFYGDFWYTSGAALADRIASGELKKPEAVICGSDHMALGLLKRLVEHGIRVPEDVIVTGFDATKEAAINTIPLTSFTPDSNKVAADAVDIIRHVVEPGAEIKPFVVQSDKLQRTGLSCGCPYDHSELIAEFRKSLYYENFDFGSDDYAIDIGRLQESYLYEDLTRTGDPFDCIHKIFNATFLLRPYGDFYLCLSENWLNEENRSVSGYPMRTKIALYATPVMGSGYYTGGEVFDTSIMHPALFEYREKPSVFYFFPVHYQNITMGYAVMRSDLAEKQNITLVTRNWLRNVNNALEITRAQYRLMSLSTRDGMTGAYNRRGMELMLEDMLKKASPDDNVLAFVIDMDGLKYINDTFGHEAGDFGITSVCDAVRNMTDDGELCVRAGGDEFYLIGIGDYSDEDIDAKIDRFNQYISKINDAEKRPYQISASVGSACIPLGSGMQVSGIVRIADAKMYENKVRKKKQRTN